MATAVFGQGTTFTWIGPSGGDIAGATNYSPNGQPSGATQDIAYFDGQTAGPLTVVSSGTSLPSTGFGSSGIYIYLSANQTSMVTFTSTVSAFSGGSPYGLYEVYCDTGSGGVTFGAPGGADTLYLYNFFGRPAGSDHPFINNSSAVCTFNGTCRWQAGGGSTYTLDFQGTGNWQVNNYCVNDNNANMAIAVQGPGTTFWNPTGYLGNSQLQGPFVVNGGKLVLQGSHPRINNQGMTLSGVFEFDAPSQSQSLNGAITGTGILQVNNGTFSLGGQSTFSGTNLLTGGELIANSAETPGTSGPLGLGDKITFSGGTLGFSGNNANDYSGNFDTAAGQQYSIDTAGQNVTFTNNLASSGGTFTKLGAGTLTLAGVSSYDGLTTISAGRLLFQGSKTGSGSITVADGAILGVTAGGTQITPAALTVGTSSGGTLGFNNISSTTTAPIAAGQLTSAGTITINVNSGTFTPGSSYPLMTWTTGSAPTVSLGILNGYIGNLSLSGNELLLNITATAYIWSGATSGTWDLAATGNWIQNFVSTVYADGGPVLFDDTASGTTSVTVGALVQPTAITVNNATKAYAIASTSGNDIGGSASLTKNGNSTLTLSGGANTYTGVTTISGGILSASSLANGGSPSDIGGAGSSAANLVLDGGTLQYTGGAANIDRLFSVSTAGGTIDGSGTGALTLSNSGSMGLSGSGSRLLTLTGSQGNTLAAGMGDNAGKTALSKNGAGTWVLTGTNTYSGATTIAGGVLQIGNGGASGTIGSGNVVNNGGLDFNRTGTVTVSGAISGTGSVTNDGTGTVILANNNGYTGGTTVNAGTLQVGNGGGTGSLSSGNNITDNGTVTFDTSSPFTMTGGILGTGNVHVESTGLVKVIGANSYTGWTLIEPNATFQPCEGNAGQLLSSVVTNNGTLKFVRQDYSIFGYTNNIVGSGRVWKDVNNFNDGDVTLLGTNTYAGVTIIAGGGIILGDGVTPGAGSIVSPAVIFTNSAVSDDGKLLEFNHPDDFVFTNYITGSGSTVAGNMGRIMQEGAGMLTLTANNDYTGGTIVSNGVVQVGNGGATGAIGTGPVNDNTLLVFNRTGTLTVAGAISSIGSIVQLGSGTTILANSNSTYTGTTTVSNGVLVVDGTNTAASTTVVGGTFGGAGTFTGPITVNAGAALAPGHVSSIGTMTVSNDVAINGNILIKVNTTLVQSNDMAIVSGTLSASGSGTLTVTNLGPDLVAGDKFYPFGGEVLPGSASFTVTGANSTWENDLATDGSIKALTVTPSVNPKPPVLQVSVSASTLNLAWPTNRGWTLQTNRVGLNASSQWFPYAGSTSLTNVSITINPAETNVFFRMVYTNTP